nr:helix-turn-helix domain-containing protein [uncultured Roseateles sp.]
MSNRLPPKDRKAAILDAALLVAADKGYARMTRDDVAGAAGVSPALVSTYFTTMAQLRRDVMRAAVKREVLPVLAQGLVARDSQALKASDDLRARALGSVR